MGQLQSLCNFPSKHDHQIITEKQESPTAEEQPMLSAQQPQKEVDKEIPIQPQRVDVEQTERERAEKSFREKAGKVARFISVEEFTNMISPHIAAIRTESPFPETDLETKAAYHSDPLLFLNGNVYYGSWNEKGEMEGKGQYLLNDGHFIEGIWAEGRLVEGRVFQKDGTYYHGKISNEMANGKGKYVSEDIIYEGEWKDNKKDGNGELLFRKDSTKYSGCFKDDEINGQGSIKWPDGNCYSGNFDNSMIHGLGKFFAASKASYAGGWVRNVMESPSMSAVYIWPDNTIRYNGGYKQGKKDGKGTLCMKSEILSGNWVENKLHGEGEFQMSNKKYKLLWRFGKLIEDSIEPLDTIETEEEVKFGPSAVYKHLRKIEIPLESDICHYKPPHLKTAENPQTSVHDYKPTTNEIQNYFPLPTSTNTNVPPNSTPTKTIAVIPGIGYFNTGGANVTLETNARGV